MPHYSPLLRAYRSCGFHNRTLAELRNDNKLLRKAIIDKSDLHIARVPNAFGSFCHQGVTYHTALTLVGVEAIALDHPSRGVSMMVAEDVGETAILWNFKILIPKEYCREELYCDPMKNTEQYDQFCDDLSKRTDIFAMEFLCCYKFYVEQVLEVYESNKADRYEPVRSADKFNHPKQEEVDDLICPYECVAKTLQWFKDEYKQMEWDFSNIQSFLNLHVGRNRKSMWPYYKRWLHEFRVKPKLVETKTMEFISMAFLEAEHAYDN